MILEKKLKELTTLFTKKDFSAPSLEAELLLATALKKSKIWIYTHPLHLLTPTEEKNIARLLKKRLDHFPLAYLRKQKEFYGFRFYVTPSVLIPRPETEQLVEETLKNISRLPLLILDVGTGSGNIIISLAKTLSSHLTRQELNFWASDICPFALRVARQNAKNLKVKNRITFFQSDLLKDLTPRLQKASYAYPHLIITANLPYLSSREYCQEKSIQAEPKIALVSPRHGLQHYLRLFQQIKKISPFFQDILLLGEINPSQKPKIAAAAPKKPTFLKDLNNQWRFFKIFLQN